LEFDLSLALSVVALFVAGLARGFIGFGAGLVIIPVLAVLYGPVEAVLTMTLVDIPATLYLMPTAVRHANWRSVAPLGIASLFTLPLGAWFLTYVEPEDMRRIIAVLVISAGIMIASGWRYSKTPSKLLTVTVGLFSGFLSGASNIGGPPVVVFLMAGRNSAIEVRAGIMAYFSFSVLFRIVIYLAFGMVTLAIFWLAVALVLPYMAGIWIGARAFSGVSEKLFRYTVLGVVLTMGGVALFR